MDNDEDKLEAGLALVGIIILFIGLYELVGYDKMTWWIPLGLLAAFSPFAIQRHRQKQEASLLQEKAVQEAEKIAEINRTAKAGTWNFPTEEFYKRCFEGKIENLGSDYGWKKAKVIAEQLILEKCPKADMSCFQSYLTKEKLQAFLETGKSQAEQTAKKKLEESKRVCEADADSYEATFMLRSSSVAGLTGCQKRVRMLTDLISDYDERIQKLKDGEEAMKQLAMIYTGAQKKESDWAILGGAANGIAGPVASAAVIWGTMKKNGEIAKYNEGMRKASIILGKSIKEIAEAEGVHEESVRQSIKRGLERMKKTF